MSTCCKKLVHEMLYQRKLNVKQIRNTNAPKIKDERYFGKHLHATGSEPF